MSFLLVYLAALVGLLLLLDRRLHAAQLRRESAFLSSFGSGVLVRQFERDSVSPSSRLPASSPGTSYLASGSGVPLRSTGRGRAAERFGGAS